ncbi:SDR family oxidoreductase [Salinibacter altiplanensis]|uniref:SDR family oxidoreductase n=1 Tax=Salinibacter altiplanensis TaxID=1803181 RepID=UPI000C9F68B8|nr:SDR family oxidoreductase [Salinibacter altiplanensis]
MIDADISILGCGWLGRPLGRHLVAHGVHVRGSTTTPEKVDPLRGEGLEPYLLTLAPALAGENASAFFESPILVLNVPPSRSADDAEAYYCRQIDAVREAASDGAVEWILFASSTGVYPNVERTVTEADQPPGRPGALPGTRRSTGRAVLAAEERLMSDPSFATTVVRLGGLYGGDRHPGRFLAGRSGIGRPEAPVNLIHREDCVALLTTLLEQDVRDEVFNACADAHPTRQALYTRAAEVLGLDPPAFDASDSTTGKRVDSQKVKDRCGYQFRRPDPLADLEG